MYQWAIKNGFDTQCASNPFFVETIKYNFDEILSNPGNQKMSRGKFLHKRIF